MVMHPPAQICVTTLSCLLNLKGMGNILTQAHIGSLRDIAGHDRLLVQLVGSQELTRQFVLRADQEITKQIFTDAFDTIWDVWIDGLPSTLQDFLM